MDFKNGALDGDRKGTLRLLELAVNASPGGVVITDATRPDNPIVYVNPAFERITGYASREVVGRKPRFMQGPDRDQPEVMRELRQAVEEGREFLGVLRNHKKDGTPYWNELRIAPVRDEEGRLTNFVGVQNDVTERVRAKEELSRLASFPELNPNPVVEIDPDGNLTYANPAAEELFSGIRTAGLGHPLLADLGPSIAELRAGRAGSRTDEVDAGDCCYQLESSLIAESGRVRIYATDVTERKEVEKRLRETEERYRVLVEQVPAVIYIDDVDETNSAIYRSPHVEEMLGYSLEEFAADPEFWQKLLHPDDRERVMAENDRTNETGEPFSIEYRLICKDGRVVWVRDEAVLIRDEEGRPRFWQGVFMDITGRKRADERLREAETKYRRLVEQIPVAVYVQEADHEGTLAYMGPQIRAMTGYAAEEYLADPEFWMKNLHPEDRERVLAEDERTDRTGEPYEVEYRTIHRDGHVVWIRNEAVLIRDEEGNPRLWQGVASDITERKETEKALRESETKYRALVERMPVVTYTELVVDETSVSNYLSPQVEDLLGYPPDQLNGSPPFWQELMHPEDRERVLALDDRVNKTGEPFGAEYRVIHRDGHVVWVRDEAVLVSIEDGTQHWQGVIYDITERKEAEEKRREVEARYRTLVEQIPAVTYIQEVEHNDTAMYVSPQIEDLTGYSPEDYYSIEELWYGATHPDDRERVLAEDDRTDETGEPFVMEYRIIHRDGHVVWVRDEAVLVADAEGRPRFWQGVMSNITERKELEERLSHQALHDSLTGLPNRSLFVDRLGQALNRAGRRGARVAVLFLDLDNFKYVNDSLGHEAGDELLVEVANRLRSLLRPEDTLARLGGDEFVVLLEDLGGEDEAVGVAERIERGLRVPFALDGHEFFVTASTGIAFGGDAGDRPDDLLRDSDTAMYRAKESGKDHHAVFSPEMKEHSSRRLGLEGDLRRALRRPEGEFRVHYQPKALVKTAEIVGVEALVRWEHPELGLVLPSDFIPLAEETGLIVPLGRWVLREACRQAKEWQEGRPAGSSLFMSVNLSARQFRDPDLAGQVEDVLEETGLDPGSLVLEITESTLMEDAPSTVAILERLKAFGVRVAIDDFGTGYSSLSYLKRFPVDVIKIDRSIVSGLERDPGNAAIVSATITLAHALDLEVVAEGVETEGEVAELHNLGCDLGQGYYWWKPRPAKETAALLETNFYSLRGGDARISPLKAPAPGVPAASGQGVPANGSLEPLS